MRDSDYILDGALKIIEEKLVDVELKLVTGSISDFVEYKYNMGYRKGIVDLQQQINDLIKEV